MNKLEQLRKVARTVNTRFIKEDAERGKVLKIAGEVVDELQLGLIPTGNPAVDKPLQGGLMRGIMSMVVGEPGTGKSHFALDTIAYNQKEDPEFVALFACTEGPFPYYQALEAGVDLNRIMILSTAGTGLTGEQVLEVVMNLLADITTKAWKPRNLIDLAVLDSVAALLPTTELSAVVEDGLNKDTVGRQAAMLSKFMRIFFGTGALGRSHLCLINQKRTKIGGYGDPTSIPGGNAVMFYPKVIIDVRANRGDYITRGAGDKQVTVGHKVKGEIKKNNTGKGHPHTKFEYDVFYGQGVDIAGPLLAYAVDLGVVQAGGAGFFTIPYGGEELRIRGKDNVIAWIREDDAHRKHLETLLSEGGTRNVVEGVGNLVPLETLDLPEELFPEEEALPG